MKLKFTITLSPTDHSSERSLAQLNFIESEPGRDKSLAVPETNIQLPDTSTLTITARYSLVNSGMSLVVCRNAKQLALMLCPWGETNPYLGLEVDKLGFLHVFCERLGDGNSPDA